MPSGDDEEIVARGAPLLGFGEDLAGVRLLVGLFASARFLGELLTAAFLIAAFLAGRNGLE
ncbi:MULTISPECIES: hypothetical protein [Bradyrhizobium]|uniref:hypothetical protein n=1 Tax=Bradyrhizobium TaxID=374 RepID=UPI0030B834F6